MIVAIVLESHELIVVENVINFRFNDKEQVITIETNRGQKTIASVVNTVCFSDNGAELSRTTLQK